MAGENHPVYCGRCYSIVYAGDRFCGECGADIPPDTQEATSVQQTAEPPYAPEHTSGHSGRRKRVLVVAVGALLVLLAGTGAVAYAALGPGEVLLGWTGFQTPGTEEDAPKEKDPPRGSETTQEPTTTAPVPADAPPDPAFDELLPELERRTENVNLLLPAKLPSVLQNVAVDRDLEGDRYGIAFFREPQQNVVEGWGRAEVYGTLRANPAEKEVSNEYFEATSVETFEMSDGAEATLRRMEPVREQGGTQGPFWEGKFREGNHVYTLILLDDTSRDMAAQLLSTMVEVPQTEGVPKGRAASRTPSTPGPPEPEGTSGSGGSPPTRGSRADLEAGAEEAAGDYYRAAGLKDWGYTYEHLEPQTQALFTEEEWDRKNRWLAGNNPVTYHIDSVDLEEAPREPAAEVAVRLTGEDGSTSVRNTYFVLEDGGSWKHRFSQEEYDLFMPGVPFEEFVEARQEGPPS